MTDTQTPTPQAEMRSIIARIATGPDLSKDISLEEARNGMRYVLDGEVDPVQGAIYLIALRMKRETDDENKGVLDALRSVTERATAPVDEVVDIADPYDGYNRTLPPAPFLAPLLAELGIPAFSHGMETVGPKYGVTHKQVLREAGLPVDLSPAQAAARLGDIGWAYVDQSRFAPKLFNLLDFRSLIVKRPAITTVEVMCGPIVGRQKTHLMTGYVHKPYPRIYAMLARHAGYDSMLLVRGVEGGVLSSLRQSGKLFFYHDGGMEDSVEMNPEDMGIQQEVRAIPVPEDMAETAVVTDAITGEKDNTGVAAAAAEAGIAALRGTKGATYDALVYGAATVLWHLKKAGSLQAGADMARSVLDSGAAFDRLR
ncbi:MAG: anthranilate phosphoribosyltransferase [Chromatiales bacterium]|nr:anthranilate phosphoribosyltransferase [Chromatiales bacterium]